MNDLPSFNEIWRGLVLAQALSHTQVRSLSGVMPRTANIPRTASSRHMSTTTEVSESNEDVVRQFSNRNIFLKQHDPGVSPGISSLII